MHRVLLQTIFVHVNRSDSLYQVTDWEGSKIDLAADQDDRRALFPSGGVLVTNRSVHDQILGLISSSKSLA